MSLDVYLTADTTAEVEPAIYVREGGENKRISREEWDRRYPGREPVVFAAHETNEVYSRNITHNLNTMAEEAGIYKAMWRPEEIGIERAKQLIEPLEVGLEKLKADPERFKEFNPSNGWGTYEGLVDFVEDYLSACRRWPEAKVGTWR